MPGELLREPSRGRLSLRGLGDRDDGLRVGVGECHRIERRPDRSRVMTFWADTDPAEAGRCSGQQEGAAVDFLPSGSRQMTCDPTLRYTRPPATDATPRAGPCHSLTSANGWPAFAAFASPPWFSQPKVPGP